MRTWRVFAKPVTYSLSLFTMNVANQLYHPCKYKTIAKMCEERITHNERSSVQSKNQLLTTLEDFLTS